MERSFATEPSHLCLFTVGWKVHSSNGVQTAVVVSEAFSTSSASNLNLVGLLCVYKRCHWYSLPNELVIPSRYIAELQVDGRCSEICLLQYHRAVLYFRRCPLWIDIDVDVLYGTLRGGSLFAMGNWRERMTNLLSEIPSEINIKLFATGNATNVPYFLEILSSNPRGPLLKSVIISGAGVSAFASLLVSYLPILFSLPFLLLQAFIATISTSRLLQRLLKVSEIGMRMM